MKKILSPNLAAVAALLMLATPAAHAAARIWSGGSGDWQTGVQGGWNGVWANGDTGTFNGPGGTVTNKSAITTGNAALAFSAGNYTLQSDSATIRTITLGNSSVTLGNGVTTTIGSNVTLARSGNNTLTFDGDTTATSTLNINSGGMATNGTVAFTIREATANVNTGGAIESGGSLVLGDTTDGATLNVLGGTVTLGTGNAASVFALGNTGANSPTVHFKITGGSLGFTDAGNALAHSLRVGPSAPGAGVVTAVIDLEGGIVTVRGIYESSSSYSSTLNFHGGTLKALADNADYINVDNIWIKSGGVTFDSNGKAITVTRDLLTDGVSTGGGLTLNDSAATKGTLTLAGALTYTGPTLVSAGKLVVPSTHAGGGGVTVSANASLEVAVSGTSQWQPASLTLGNPCTLEFNNLQNPGTTTAPILPTAAVGAVSGVTINVISIPGVVVGNSYPLLGNQGGTTNGYTLGTQPPGVTGSLGVSGTTLVYTVSSAADIWTGVDGTNPTWWDIGTTVNWAGKAVNNSPSGTYADGDDVLFDDTATPASPVAVEIQTAVAPGNMLFNNSSKDYTVSGASGIAGSGSLTKTGTGTLTLSAALSYSGATLVSAGKLVVPSTHSGTGAATVSTNATLGVVVSGTNQWQPASLTLADPCTLEFNDVQNPGTTTAPLLPTAAVGPVTNVTINVISIPGAVAGNSYPLLGNQGVTTNGYTLGTQPPGVTGSLGVNGTTLVYTVSSVADIWAGADGTNPTWWDIATTANWAGKALNNTTPGTYADGDDVLFDDTATSASPVAVEIQTAVAPGDMVFNSSKNYTVNGPSGIGGTGTLIKSGNGTLTLGTDNSYSGATIINQGTLSITHSNALGSTAGATTISPTISSNASLVLNDATADLAVAENLNFISTSTLRARLENTSAFNHTLSGNINVDSSAAGAITEFRGNTAGSIIINGDITGSVGTGSSFLIRGATVGVGGVINGNITLTGGGLSKADPGTWTIGAPGKTYMAPIINVNQGILRLGADNYLASSTVLNLGNAISGGGTFDLNGFSQTLAGLTTGNPSGAKIITSSSGNPVLTVNNIADYAPNSTLTLQGSLSLTKQGAGKLTLSGVSTYTGATIISAGTLALANDTAINLTSGLSIAAGGTLDTVALTVPPPSSIPLTASGTGTNVGTTAAAIIGVSGFPHDLGTRSVILNYDGSNPALYLSAGTLNLNDNPFTINGAVLANGVYTIIAQSDAPAMTGSVAFSTVNGTALTGKTGTVSISGNTVVLTVTGSGPGGPATLTNSVSGGVMTLTWPAGETWRLIGQTNSLSSGLNPGTNSWFTVPGGVDGSNSITIDPANPSVFYRLVSP